MSAYRITLPATGAPTGPFPSPDAAIASLIGPPR